MISADTPMSPIMRIVFWFVAANALAGALSLMRTAPRKARGADEGEQAGAL